MRRFHIKPRFSIYHWSIGLSVQRLFEYSSEDLRAILETGAKSHKFTGIEINVNLLFLWFVIYCHRVKAAAYRDHIMNKALDNKMSGFRESYGVESDPGSTRKVLSEQDKDNIIESVRNGG